jgi:uncharacterized protein YegL
MSDKKTVTHVVLILDRSGSMSSLTEQAVAGYNEQVKVCKKAENEVKVSLLTFDNDVTEHLWEVSAQDLQEANYDDYTCDGCTALLNAIGYAITKLKKTTDWQNEENVYLIITITDGQNNIYEPFTADAIKEMSESVQKGGNWTFSFIGCDANYLRNLAKTISVPVANCAVMTASVKGYDYANRLNAAKTMKYMHNASSGARGKMLRAKFYSEDDGALASADMADADVDVMAFAASNQASPPIDTPKVSNLWSTGDKVDLGQWQQC